MSNLGKISKINKLLATTSMLTAILASGPAYASSPTVFTSDRQNIELSNTSSSGITTEYEDDTLSLNNTEVLGDIGDSTNSIANLVVAGTSSVSGATYVNGLTLADGSEFSISNTLNVTNNITVVGNSSLLGADGLPQIKAGSVNLSDTNLIFTLSNVELIATTFQSSNQNTIALSGEVNLNTSDITIGQLLLNGETNLNLNGKTLTIGTLDFNNHNLTLSGGEVNLLTALVGGTKANVTIGVEGIFSDQRLFTEDNQVKTLSGTYNGNITSAFTNNTVRANNQTITGSVGTLPNFVNFDVDGVGNIITQNAFIENLTFSNNGSLEIRGKYIYINQITVNADATLIGNTNAPQSIPYDDLDGNVPLLIFFGDHTITFQGLSLTTQQINANHNITIKGINSLLTANDGMIIEQGKIATLNGIDFEGDIMGLGDASLLILHDAFAGGNVSVWNLEISGNNYITGSISTQNLSFTQDNTSLSIGADASIYIININADNTSLTGYDFNNNNFASKQVLMNNGAINFSGNYEFTLSHIDFEGNVTTDTNESGSLKLENSNINGNVGEEGFRLYALTINAGNSSVTGKIFANDLNLGGNLAIGNDAHITNSITLTNDSRVTKIGNGIGAITANNLVFNGNYSFTLDRMDLTINDQIRVSDNASIVGYRGAERVEANALVFENDNYAFTLQNLYSFAGNAITNKQNNTLTLDRVAKFDGNIGEDHNAFLEVIINGANDSKITGNVVSWKISLTGTGGVSIGSINTGELDFRVDYTEVTIGADSVIDLITVTSNNTALIGNSNRRLEVRHEADNTPATLNFTADSQFTLQNIGFFGDVLTDTNDSGKLILAGSIVYGYIGTRDQFDPRFLNTITINTGQSEVTQEICANALSFAEEGGNLFMGEGATIENNITVTGNNTSLHGWDYHNDRNTQVAVNATAIKFDGDNIFDLRFIKFTGNVTTAHPNSGVLVLDHSIVNGNIGAVNNALKNVPLNYAQVTGNITSQNIEINYDSTVTGDITGNVTFKGNSTLNASNINGNITIDDAVTATLRGAGLLGITDVSGAANSVLNLQSNIRVNGNIGLLKEINLGNNVELRINGGNATQNITGTDSSNITIKNQASGANINNVGTQNAPINSLTLENGGTLLGNIYAKTIKVNNAAAKTLELKKSITANVELSGGAHNINIGEGLSLNGDIILANQGGILSFEGDASFRGNLGKNNPFTQLLINNEGKVAGSGSIYAIDVNHSAGTLYLNNDLTIKGSYNLKGGTLDINSYKLMVDKLVFGASNSTIKVDMASGGYISAKDMDFVDNSDVNIIITDNIVQQTGSVFDLIVSDNTTQDRSKILEYLSNDKLVKIISTNRFGNYILKLSPVENGSNGVKLQAITERQASKDIELVSAISSSAQEILQELLSAWDHSTMSKDAESFISSLGNMDSLTAADAVSRIISASVSSVAQSVVSSSIAASHSSIASRFSVASMALAAADDRSVELGPWSSAFGAHASQKAYGKQEGYKNNAKGFSVGLDAQMNEDTMVGLAASHNVSKVKLAGEFDGDIVDATNYAFSFYGAKNLAHNFFTEGSASLANSHIKSASNRTFGANYSMVAKSKFDIVSYSAQAIVGYNYKIANHTVLAPIAGISYVRYNPASTKETGAGIQNRTIDMKAINKVNGVFGGRMNHNIILDDNNLINLELHVTGERAFKSKAASVDIKLGGYDKSLSYGSEKPARNIFNAGTSVTAKSGAIEYGAGYDLQLSKKYNAHQGSVKLKVYF